jgi:hypothetical protein
VRQKPAFEIRRRFGVVRRNALIYFHDGDDMIVMAAHLGLPSPRAGSTTTSTATPGPVADPEGNGFCIAGP